MYFFARCLVAAVALLGLSAQAQLSISARESGHALPSPSLPAADVTSAMAGTQLLRLSMPCAPGALLFGDSVEATVEGKTIPVQLRILTAWPGQPRSARRAIFTMPIEFESAGSKHLTFKVVPPANPDPHIVIAPDQRWAEIQLDGNQLVISANGVKASAGELHVIGLGDLSSDCRVEMVEGGAYYAWLRVHTSGPEGKRIMEVRADCLGTIALSIQVQRAAKGDGFAPAFGWSASGPSFSAPSEAQPNEVRSSDGSITVSFPTLEPYGRGKVELDPNGALNYWRCTPEEQVPWQEMAWRSAEIVAGATGHTPRNTLLEPTLDVTLSNDAYAPLLGNTPAADLAPWPGLAALSAFTRDGIVFSVTDGDDFGDVTGFNAGAKRGGRYGMNRLNHAPSMFEWAWRYGDRRLRDTGVQWCLNNYDLSIWWGEGEGHGGTRYNNAVAAGKKEHEGDKNFMWRLNEASNFCTKGFDTFYYAYEETGDPRHVETLKAQLAYAAKNIHTDKGEARNIGDVRDFLTLYHATGEQQYLDEALRLFRELRPLLSTGDLFSQGGQPLEADPPFINDDAVGYSHPFAKPYIIGYALNGLPDLLRIVPDEPKLRDVVRAVADFLAETVDPVGGWRYPHPKSVNVLVAQGIEHANQICNAAGVLEERGEPIENLLDAVETVLQSRVMGYLQGGAILGINGWENAAGALPAGTTVYDLYKKPADRDPARDYTEGAVGFGGAPPEGLVYFDNVLRFYLAHRPAERLFHANPQLQQVLARAPKNPPALASVSPTPSNEVLGYGMKNGLPAFAPSAVARLEFPLSFAKAGLPFVEWRTAARMRYLASLQAAPPRADFNAEVLATEDRGDYEARKLALNISADSRVHAYLLVPKHAPGTRLPAVLALHDHGAHFSIGKEKVIKPFGVDEAVLQDAQQWVDGAYGGRWFGDELAKRGYVVFSTDALFWGERGRAEGVDYKAQETLSVNLQQLGMSFAGNIVWDDLRAAEFVQSLPEVNPARIGAMGLSMGAHRTWNLAAATDIVKAGCAICWLGDTPTLMAEGNNQTKGQSSHSMTFPGLRTDLDYADVASVACPKPMLFYNGEQDALFPVPGVNAAYATLHKVYASQEADAQLETRLWPVPHVFNAEMQDAAFAWLDAQLKPK